ncbi:GNAT family N-acetyltransferase [Roseobacter sinensis]|uniref:GNAT family N-acetyltransferase n=1 Tax=Roseobacter sinensis TaxID=2931391 RepID=A0ABT3BGC8_9RHOB|nr:GNAT family N-acetyltransferase [Roseobacter sp. WL0113]MCV3272228.1 GNAT family N-acetyltransferase [Roseobacter sp. WL0113]
MTPEGLAALHERSFTSERPWSASEFTDLLADAHVRLLHRDHGFALIRTVADESELLTLAVHPDHRRQNIADALVTDWLKTVKASIAFLEVAADNEAARALYSKHGFAESGRRQAYYRRDGAAPVDAVLMTAALPPRQLAESPAKPSKTG